MKGEIRGTMNAPDFKPSDVDMEGSFPPFVDTFKKTEAEVCAALLVRTCLVKGDEWQALDWSDIASQIRADVAAKVEPIFSLATNPFAIPDVHRLIKDGYAEWRPEGQLRIVGFTEKGFEALRKWVRPERKSA
jgi:hypothetical protein